MGSDNKVTDETASDIQALASRWVVERHGASIWSDDDQARLDSWLNESVAHSVAYWRANHVWNRADRLVALKRPPEQDVRNEKRGLRSSTLSWAVATIAILVFVGALVSLNAFRTNYVTYSTAVGAHRVLMLADGSRIELNTDSVLRLAKGGSRSEAILDKGEAYFDIKHNADNPFTVVAHGRRIVDVGTKFLVRENSDALKVSMLEGRVALSAPARNAGTPTELKAGDVAIATASATKVVRSSVQALADTAEWRNGYLTFRHITLADAVAEFNRYNNAKLNVEGAGVSSKKIYGTFRTTDVKLFASVAQDVLHLHVERRGDEIVLSR
jgi:transmembrane sensor